MLVRELAVCCVFNFLNRGQFCLHPCESTRKKIKTAILSILKYVCLRLLNCPHVFFPVRNIFFKWLLSAQTAWRLLANVDIVQLMAQKILNFFVGSTMGYCTKNNVSLSKLLPFKFQRDDAIYYHASFIWLLLSRKSDPKRKSDAFTICQSSLIKQNDEYFYPQIFSVK